MKRIIVLSIIGVFFACCHAGQTQPTSEPSAEWSTTEKHNKEPHHVTEPRPESLTEPPKDKADSGSNTPDSTKPETTPEPIIEKDDKTDCITISVKNGEIAPPTELSGSYPTYSIPSEQESRVRILLGAKTKPEPRCTFSSYQWTLLEKPPGALGVIKGDCADRPQCSFIITKKGVYRIQLETADPQNTSTQWAFTVDGR